MIELKCRRRCQRIALGERWVLYTANHGDIRLFFFIHQNDDRNLESESNSLEPENLTIQVSKKYWNISTPEKMERKFVYFQLNMRKCFVILYPLSLKESWQLLFLKDRRWFHRSINYFRKYEILIESCVWSLFKWKWGEKLLRITSSWNEYNNNIKWHGFRLS